MSKQRANDEFNPWPPFVDIFASVILVMILFLLITIVNIAYYSQFKFKRSFTGLEVAEDPDHKILIERTVEGQTKERADSPPVVEARIIQPTTEKETSKAQVNEVKEQAQKQLQEQAEPKTESDIGIENAKEKEKIMVLDKEVVIIFFDTHLFFGEEAKSKIKQFIHKCLKNNPEAKVRISAGEPQKVVSNTVRKQISLGRILTLKSLVMKEGYNKNQIKLDLFKRSKLVHEFGYIKIEQL